MKIGSLFSGAGGLDLGVQAALGGEVVWHCENDLAASRVLAHHWPGVPNLGDITTVDWARVEPVDVLTGGFPCQDVSTAGKRGGLRPDTRSGLWTHMAYAIDQLRPSLVIIENVRGLLSATADSDVEFCPWCMGETGLREPDLRALGAVLGDLADLLYDAEGVGLRAADVGACHGRFRVFLVAYPRGEHGVERWLAASGQAARGRALGEPARRGGMGALPTRGGTDAAGDASVWGRGRPTDAMPALRSGDGQEPPPTDRAQQLLPTPRATDGTKGGPGQRGSSGDLMLPSAVTLLPTPSAADGGGGHLTRSGHRSGERLLPGVARDLAAQRLLPTPRSIDRTSRAAATRKDSRSGPSLGQAVEIAQAILPAEFNSWHDLPPSWQPNQLLPTPTAMDSRASGGDPDSSDVTLTDATVRGRREWGVYADAIARWETLTRPAPPPTQPSSKGTPQLSPRFVEWMMGLPEGHVSSVPGVTRNQALTILGNGVVPQQCVAAIAHLLDRIEAAA